MSGTNEQARRDALHERNEERKILGEMLEEPGCGGISRERTAALQKVFERRYPSTMPKSQRGLAADKEARLEGLAEMAMTRVRSSLIEEVEEEEVEEEGPISDGITMSYSLNGARSTEEELDEGDIPRRIIKEKNEQGLAQSTPAPAVSFLAQLQKQRAEEGKIKNMHEAEWGHYRSFEVREQIVEEEKAVEMDTEEDNVVGDDAAQKLDGVSKSDEVA